MFISGDSMGRGVTVVISTPFGSVPAGGFLRDARVLPYLLELLAGEGFDTVLHVPVYSVARLMMLLVNSGLEYADAVKTVYRDAYMLERLGLSMPFLYDSIDKGVRIAWKMIHEDLMLRRIRGFGFFYVHGIIGSEKKLVRHLLDFLGGRRVEFIYSMNENLEHFMILYEMCRGLNTSCGLMIQYPLYVLMRTSFTRRAASMISSLYINGFVRRRFLELVRGGYLRIILSVSPAPFMESGDLVYNAGKHGVHIAIPYPANALDPLVFKYRSVSGDKPPIAVYFGRISPEKGCFDLVKAWSIIEEWIPDAELWIIGSFESSRVKHAFFRYVEKLKLKNLRYLGYVQHGVKLYEAVSKAKVLMYPSYEDSFSLTVLEALGLGLMVVAYDIPAIRYLYGRIPAVAIVNKGDVKALSMRAFSMLKMDHSEYLRLQTDPKTLEFIKAHSSWRNVAIAEFNHLKKTLLQEP